MATIFSKIIEGEVPAHKIYEDDTAFAFLDIHPIQPGHILVVPKIEVDRLEDLDDETYVALMSTVRKLMRHVRETLGVPRVCLKVEGFDIPHAHIHVIPCRQAADFYSRPDMNSEPDDQALAEMAERLSLS